MKAPLQDRTPSKEKETHRGQGIPSDQPLQLGFPYVKSSLNRRQRNCHRGAVRALFCSQKDSQEGLRRVKSTYIYDHGQCAGQDENERPEIVGFRRWRFNVSASTFDQLEGARPTSTFLLILVAQIP